MGLPVGILQGAFSNSIEKRDVQIIEDLFHRWMWPNIAIRDSQISTHVTTLKSLQKSNYKDCASLQKGHKSQSNKSK